MDEKTYILAQMPVHYTTSTEYKIVNVQTRGVRNKLCIIIANALKKGLTLRLIFILIAPMAVYQVELQKMKELQQAQIHNVISTFTI